MVSCCELPSVVGPLDEADEAAESLLTIAICHAGIDAFAPGLPLKGDDRMWLGVAGFGVSKVLGGSLSPP